MNKNCTKCKQDYPATLEYFYKNSGGKFGLTPRCKPCVNLDNQLSHQKRLKKNPKKIKELANIRAKRSYQKHLEKNRERQRNHKRIERLDPIKRLKIQPRKRGGGAGLSPEDIEIIRVNQNNLCAICSTPNPTDLDHCHKTNRIRWLLCTHCNRGLGAFKDNPALLIKAANMLNEIKDNS